MARILDDLVRIPGTRRTVGLDPLLGVLPGVGDWVGLVASTYLLVCAARLGASAPLILRMTGNAVIDATVGSVPLLGDLFDLGWKANRRNLALLERHVADPPATARSSKLVVGAVLAVVLTATAGLAVGAVMLLRWVVHLVTLVL